MSINTADIITYHREEAFISAGESGEPEALHSTGDSSESSTAFGDASEEVLEVEGEGVWVGGNAGGVPADDGQVGIELTHDVFGCWDCRWEGQNVVYCIWSWHNWDHPYHVCPGLGQECC